ncbi:hypothetical protein JB92DRAFT_2829982 [Gautieria morchelliformis]|nr:hypothetical protein JB92DRAFT_2829982 [Gautieria morchelliformis]
MDSRASTSTSTRAGKAKTRLIETKHGARVSLSPRSSPFATFRPSPLGPKPPRAPPPGDQGGHTQKRSPFPASQPLRPFPSIAQPLGNPRAPPPDGREPGGPAKENVQRGPKTLEISSKWRGGFLVLGMTQAEFSRRD